MLKTKRQMEKIVDDALSQGFAVSYMKKGKKYDVTVMPVEVCCNLIRQEIGVNVVSK
jgi:hypothetical protein